MRGVRNLDNTELLALSREFPSFRRLASHLRCDRTALKTLFAERNIPDPTPPLREEPEPLELPVGDEWAVDWESRAKGLEAYNKQLKKQLDKLRQGYAIMAGIIRSEVKTFPPVVPRYKLPKHRSVDEELVMIHISDSHIGEWVLPEHTAGLEQYDRDVFLERKQRLMEGIDSIVNGHVRETYPIKHCLVHFYGDIATHENIYKGQAFRIDMPLVEQIIWGAHEMADLVRYLAGMFETVTVFEQEGNHGATMGTTLNTDWLLYYTMNCVLSSQPNVSTVLSDSPYLAYFIDESVKAPDGKPLLDYSEGGDRWNAIMAHGHQVRRYHGTPYYGLDRFVGRLTNIFRIVWDSARCGHHHEPGEGSGWELVPSWLTGTDYTVGRLTLASRPQQLINGFHPRKHETWKYKIDLADRPHLDDPEDGGNVLTPHNKMNDLIALRGAEAPSEGTSCRKGGK